MTNKNIYLFGRLYKAFISEYKTMDTPLNYQKMSVYPFITLTELHNKALKIGMTKTFQEKIGRIINELDHEGIEAQLTIEEQGVFALAYYKNGTMLQTKISNMKITQDELAEQIGVQRNIVSAWLSGTSTPNKTNAHKLAEFFNVDEDILLI